MSTIAIYSRKSKFTDKGQSIENQIKMCKDYVYKHFDCTDTNMIVYEDEGFSGVHIDRPKFKQMMKDAKNNKFSVLICYRLDRISRNVSNFSETLEVLQKYNISFVSVREQFDTSKPMGRAMMYISSVFAQLERETIAERIRDNMYQLAKTGRWLGGKTPMGFKSEEIQYLDSELNQRKMYKLSPLPKELHIVERLFQKYIALNSLTQLTSWTIKNNIKTKTGKYFDNSTLKIILSNPVYCIADNHIYRYFAKAGCNIEGNTNKFDGIHGLMVFNKNDIKKNKVIKKDISEWIIAVGKHKGILNSSDWIKVQNTLKSNSTKKPRQGTGKYGLLSGLIKCQHCNSIMRVSISNKPYGFYYYYKCLTKEKSRNCDCNIKNINGKIADKLVIKKLKKLSMDKNMLIKQLNRKKIEIYKLDYKYLSKKNQLTKQLQNCEEAINNLTIQLAENRKSVASKYIIYHIKELNKKVKNTKKQLHNIEKKVKSPLIQQQNIDILKDLFKYFAATVDQLELYEQKSIIKKTIHNITWDGNDLKVKIYS